MIPTRTRDPRHARMMNAAEGCRWSAFEEARVAEDDGMEEEDGEDAREEVRDAEREEG